MDSKAFTRHFREIFGWRESELSAWHGIEFIFAIVVPLLVGWAIHQPSLGFIGALAGLLFGLGDSGDPLPKRLFKLAQTAASVLVLGTIGARVGGNSLAFWTILAVLLFATAALSLSSHPFAAPLRLGAIALASVAGLPSPGFSLVEMVLFAALLSAATRWFDHRMFPSAKGIVPPSDPFPPLSRAAGARFCACYALAVAAALWIGQTRGVSHPTWIATTVLLVMQPDARASIERIVQRGFGTFCGVAAAALTVAVFHSTPALLLAVTLLAYLTPHASARNYWLQSALIAWLILVLYDFALATQFNSHFLAERLSDVTLGCVLALLATLGAFAPIRKPQPSQPTRK